MRSLEAVYTVFSRYRLRLTSSCEHCLPDREEARAIPLRARAEGDLYLCGLLNTIGDKQDFKHLLPRLLEVFSRCTWQRELVVKKLTKQIALLPGESAALRDFFEEEFVLALRADDEVTLFEAAQFSVQLLAVELANARSAPAWYARLINEIGRRHASSGAPFPFEAKEQVIVDWVFSEGRLEFLEAAFFESSDPADQSLFSTALETLEFWAGR